MKSETFYKNLLVKYMQEVIAMDGRDHVPESIVEDRYSDCPDFTEEELTERLRNVNFPGGEILK